MSRETDEILAYATSDPRMLAIPAVASAVWLRMVASMRRMRATCWRFGAHVPELSQTASGIGVSVEEVDGSLSVLLQVGALLREADGALSCPLLAEQEERRRLAAERREERRAAYEAEVVRAVAAGEEPPVSARTAANRINGRLGGRPRKDGLPSGQRAMPFYGVVPPVSGNPMGSLSAAVEANPKNPFAFSRTGGLIDCSESEKQSINQPTAAPRMETDGAKTDGAKTHSENRHRLAVAEIDRIGRKVLQLADLPETDWQSHSRTLVAEWLTGGLSEADVIEAATTALGRVGQGAVRSLAWFTPVMRMVTDRRSSPNQETPEVTLGEDAERAFKARNAEWRAAVAAGDLKIKRPRRADFLEQVA